MVIEILKITPDPRRKTGFTPLRIYYHIVNYIYLSLFDCCSGYPFWVDNSFSLSGRLISVFGLFSVRSLLFVVSSPIFGFFDFLAACTASPGQNLVQHWPRIYTCLT